MDTAAEQQVIRRVLAGDADAYRMLMDRHLPAVLRMTFRITGCQFDAEEAAQEAFVRAYNKLATFREDAAFGTWVYRIAMNCSLNLLKRKEHNPAWQAVALEDAPAGVTVSAEPTPEAMLLQAEAARAREQAMQTLSAMERTAFVLRHLEEQTVDTIASALGVNSNTARQAIFRAVSKLRRELAPAPAPTVRTPRASGLVRETR